MHYRLRHHCASLYRLAGELSNITALLETCSPSVAHLSGIIACVSTKVKLSGHNKFALFRLCFHAFLLNCFLAHWCFVVGATSTEVDRTEENRASMDKKKGKRAPWLVTWTNTFAVTDSYLRNRFEILNSNRLIYSLVIHLFVIPSTYHIEKPMICIEIKFRSLLMLFSRLYVRLGDYDLAKTDEANHTELAVLNHTNPGYLHSTKRDDISILTLERDVIFNGK